MNENINLVDILKDAPRGTKLWSPICGDCKLFNITSGTYPIGVSTEENNSQTFTFMSNGCYADYTNAECLLFPSKENRNWSTFKLHKKHKHFKPFENVLITMNTENGVIWYPAVYALYNDNKYVHMLQYGGIRKDNEIIPYEGNEDKLGKLIEQM